MVQDSIGDMLIQIKNAALARNRTVILPASKTKQAVANILVSQKYLESAQTTGQYPNLQLVITLAYDGHMPVLTDIKRQSKPGLRKYIGSHDIPTVMGGLGIAILSTPEGMMTGHQAKQKGIGGEFICEVW